MRKAISVITGVLLFIGAYFVTAADSTWEFSVQVSATAQSSPPQINLSWPQDTYMLPNSYTVYRKAPGDTSWGTGTPLPGTATSYTDNSVVAGIAYEYQIVKVTSQYTGYGYIYAGMNVPMTDNRGKLLLVVENTYAANLTNELAVLQQDLVGDGWTVTRLDVGRSDSVVSVKNLIRSQYTADPSNVKAVFLFGHVPVPYSGNIVPDGHVPNHQGAWPCDGFYGDMDGTWTDTTVNDTGADDARNRNVPGDGKFDQSSFPAAIKLMVGRVDLANMPGALWTGGPTTFPSELDLLRNYLNKDHKFRTKQFNLPRRGIVGDFFGVRSGEAFAASGYRNFSTFFGANNVTNIAPQGAWTPTLRNAPYLWAYGCGAGSYTSIEGLGNSDSYFDVLTRELYTNDVQAVFTLFFGSWLGDWDSSDNIMRGVLALPSYGLTCAWSGRPHWFLQHMALGETIGFGARLTQNNGPSGLYQNQLNSAAGQIHIALMGDPTLRMHVVAPPSNVTAATNGGSLSLNWAASSDSVIGYHVYSATSATGPFTRLTTSPLTSTSYTDATGSSAANYMVRAVKLETSASGTYFNPSQGAFLTPAGSSTNGTTIVAGGGTNSTSNAGSTNTSTITNTLAWVDDALPTGAVAGTDGGDSWNWVSSNPSPYSGSVANQSSIGAGLHQHFFTSATQTLTASTGDVLSAYVYLDPANLPGEIMLQWSNGSWEHRAYWGASLITYGVEGTASRRLMGALPAAGQWVQLQVPASQVGLEGSTLNGMAFSQYNGRATWDDAGKLTTTTVTNNPPVTTNSPVTSVLWVDDSLPTGAVAGTDGGDAWNWVSSNPTPYSGSLVNQSTIGAGLHQHYFASATQTLAVNAGDVVSACVYLDPANLPSEVMLQWCNGSWEHRAYWGANNITYGADGTAGRHYMGALPAAGQWTLLQVPASQVGLEGSTLSGMAFSQYDGRATWDAAGKASALSTNSPVLTNNPPTLTNSPSTNTLPISTNLPGISPIDYATMDLPAIGSNTLHVLSPTMLELVCLNTKAADPATITNWNFVSNNQLSAPPASSFVVTANGLPVAVAAIGFKRRPFYAPLVNYDLRIGNYLYLQLVAPISDNQIIQVTNPGGALWSGTIQFIAKADPLRYSPAIHVNQEGYMPNYPKQAMVGFYLGSLGEMSIPSSAGFKLVDANTGSNAYTGTLVQRPDVGFTYSPTPYQQVYQADFSNFNLPGEYRLVVPGLGASLPFLITDGIGMAFARAYALGLYHQRCGTNTAMPYTRFTHDVCHHAPAAVPTSSSAYPFTWTTISGYASQANNNNPPQIAPLLTSPAAQLFPYQNQGPVDVSGGHHDAGDYSKYTINSASLVHYLMFEVDSLPGVAALDNLGIPESGDGISDIMQEAKWEADFLAKLQDTDGGFYFIVYPQNREYEGNVTPDHGDPQVVWPKSTSVTAASVAALAQCASSPLFKQTYPAAAALYLQKAKLGWQFLTNAIAQYGKNGAYQKITFYGDDWADNDEMAWAACQMFLATGDQDAHQKLLSWFDPSDAATWRWGWWHMSQCWGHAIRSYAFAVQSGRVSSTSQLNATFLSKCQAQVAAAGDDVVTWSQQSAYGTSLPSATKAVQSPGWYFSTDNAFDMAVAYQLNPRTNYINALIANMNYEGGCNPVNVTYVSGLGWKRQRNYVSQWQVNDKHILPPSGLPAGNVQTSFSYLWNYAGELEELCFPSDGAATAPYPFYDRWGDTWNVSAEMVCLNSARSLGALAFFAAQTAYKNQPWKAINAQINVPSTVAPVGSNLTLTLSVPGMDLNGARVVWEARDQQPSFGPTFTLSPINNGVQWVEAEAQWPDGRRVFATNTFTANSPNVVWVAGAVPAGATTGADGGDSWNWVSSNPAPQSGSLAHQSALVAGEHQHFFYGATATMSIGAGDTLYAWVYLDPANLPSELMLQWTDGSWEHRAYWGANTLAYGVDGTASRIYMGALPAAGQWVQLKVPASKVNLVGSALNGMAFTVYGGRATWDAAGRLSTMTTTTTATAASIAPSVSMSSLGATLTWPSTIGGTYTVSYKDSLTSSTWTQAAQLTASNTITSWTDPGALTSSMRFYQVLQN